MRTPCERLLHLDFIRHGKLEKPVSLSRLLRLRWNEVGQAFELAERSPLV
jgi:hypothetical protein